MQHHRVPLTQVHASWTDLWALFVRWCVVAHLAACKQRAVGCSNTALAMQVLVIIVLLHFIIGVVPALTGLAVAVLVVPLNTTIGKIIHRLRKDLIAKTDARVKLVSEIINGAALLRALDCSWACDAHLDRVHSTLVKKGNIIKLLSIVQIHAW